MTQCVKNAVGNLLDPTPLVDDKELARWAQSECMVYGIMMAMAIDLHLELIHKHTDGSVWDLWLAIEAKHIQEDSSVHHRAWMGLLSYC